MSSFLPTTILRHRKENLKKCSLRGLEERKDLLFYTYPLTMPSSLNGYVMLHLDQENTQELSMNDKDCGLFLLDSTWNYEMKMHDTIKKNHSLIYRSLPKNFVTAYPRKQTACLEPERGLATVEALYIAYIILQRDTDNLLKYYHWHEAFLKKNAESFDLLKQSLQR
jgi:pre-rRNA-processing protein TSR3